MNRSELERVTTSWHYHLLLFGALVLLGSVLYVPYTPGPIQFDIPEIALPVAIAVGLGAFGVRVRRSEYDSTRLKRAVLFGWAGAAVATAISAWWIGLHVFHGSPIVGLGDQILTVVSTGIGGGVLVGSVVADRDQSSPDPARTRVLGEASWVTRSESNPIVATITDLLAEIQSVDPLELDPLYTHVDPDVFSEIRAHSDSQWQLLFYVDDYEVRVGSQGTVTIYEADVTRDRSLTVASD